MMYKEFCENGEICVYNEEKQLIFKVGNFLLHKDDGREIGLTYREGQGKLSFKEEGNLMALSMEGMLERKIPSFGYQPSLSDQNSVSVELQFAKEHPFLAIYQHKEWWLRPFFGKESGESPRKTQLLVRRCAEGKDEKSEEYEILLAVCGENCRADMEGIGYGIRITLSSNLCNQMRVEDLAVIYGRGREPYRLIEDAVDMALRLSGKRLELRRDKKYPEIFEKMGWCTWDSLGQQVNEKAIFEKMDEFKALGLPVPWVLIDDGWSQADMDQLQLSGLDADKEKFPRGLSHTIRILKEKYQVSYVGVWQGIKGYWHGIKEGSEAERILANDLLKYPNGEITMKPEPEKAFGFWNTWHSHLKKEGVDFIKVDSQSSYSLCSRGVGSYGQASAAIHTGLEASADLHFGGNLINCMGMAPEDVWNRQSAVLSRNSDDFFPRLKGSFQEHALQNCYNSVYHGCFYWEDWDMAWSEHDDAKQNLMLRMISGGPVYFSDGLGHTDTSMIWPMILEDGTVLRCEDVGRPTLDCLTEDVIQNRKPLKVYNRYGDTIYVAAFGIVDGQEGDSRNGQRDEKNDALSGRIQKSDFPELSAEEYWIYDWSKQTATLCGGGEDAKKVCGAGENDESYSFSVPSKDAALFHVIPKREKVQIIGILEKYMSGICAEQLYKLPCAQGGALSIHESCEGAFGIPESMPPDRRRDFQGNTEQEYFVSLKCGGTFGFLTQEQVKEVKYNGKEVSFERQGDFYRVNCQEGKGILQIKVS